jgi:hypothetical protein
MTPTNGHSMALRGGTRVNVESLEGLVKKLRGQDSSVNVHGATEEDVAARDADIDDAL